MPPLTAAEQAALRPALALAGIPADRAHAAYASAWRQAAAREAVDGEPPAPDGYAFSPRSTRGARRA